VYADCGDSTAIERLLWVKSGHVISRLESPFLTQSRHFCRVRGQNKAAALETIGGGFLSPRAS
jgi:hypothetical protein